MNRCLRDEPIWRGYSKKACEERGHAEQRKVVVEARGLAQRELGSLRDQRLGVTRVNLSERKREREGHTETLWSKKKRIQRMIPNGSASATHFPSSCQKCTSHGRPCAGWNAAPTGSVSGRAVWKLPQYAAAEVATSASGIP